MGKLLGGGGGSSTTTTSPWAPAEDALKNILNQAGQLFDKQGGINAEFIEKEIADLTPEMQQAVKNLVNSDTFTGLANQINQATQQGISGIGQATGILGGLANKGVTADDINKMAGELIDTEMVKGQKEQLGKDLEAGLNKRVQGLNQQASAGGGMGSSRAGVAEGVMTGEAADAYAQGSAAIENAARGQAYQQALGTLQGNQQTALGAAGQLGSLGINSGQLMGSTAGIMNQGFQNALMGAGILQQHQQNILNNKWFNATGQQNAGWNNLNNYLGIAGSIGGMGSTTTGPSKSNASGVGALLGGAGSIVSGGATAGWWSDARLKDEVELVKEAHTRVNQEGVEYPVPALYTWKWNDKALALFEEHKYSETPPAFGVLADELLETGFEEFVEEVDTEVEGLGGKVKLVNYLALCLYVGLDEMDKTGAE